MKQLSHESQALLAEARRSEHLTPSDKARIRSKLTRRIGAGLALGSALTATATVAEAAHTGALASVIAWLPAVTKVVSVIALTGAVSVGVVKVTQQSSRLPVIHDPSAARANGTPRAQPPAKGNAVSSSSTPVPSERSVPASVAPNESRAATYADATPSALPPVRSTRMVPNKSTPNERMEPARAGDGTGEPTERNVTDRLTSQVAAIRTARAAIRDGDAQAALATLDREMPEGTAAALAPEAALARVAAHCRLGQVDAARRTAERFARDYPQSPLAARLRDSCVGTVVSQP